MWIKSLILMWIKSLILLSVLQRTLTISEKDEWVTDLTNYIRSDLKVNQVIFLIVSDKQDVNSRIEAVIRTISKPLPTRKIEFPIDDSHHQDPELNIEDPQTSLFVMINSKQTADQDLSLLNRPISFVSNLSPSRSRPKCLIILLDKADYHNYENLLRLLWSNDFLDASLLTVSVKESEQNHFLVTPAQQLVRIHYFNPHTDEIKVEKYRPRIHWFPDKVRDLQGYKIKVAFKHNPPFAGVETDRSGRETVTGLGSLKMKALAKYMNFQMIIKNHERWGLLNCTDKFSSTVIYHSLIHKEVQFLATEFGRFRSCDEMFYEWSKGILESNVCLVVPVLPIESYSLTAGWKILNLFAVISLPLIVWIFTRLVHFDIQNWRWTYLVQIVLGSSVPREPQRLAERIIFVSFLITCFLYSSVIFTAFTEIGFEKRKSFELETIEDVISSNLKTVIIRHLAVLIYNNSNSIQRRLIEKAVIGKDSVPMCIQQLTANKNVICTAFSLEAEYLLQNQRDDKCGLPVAEILDDCLSNTLSGTVLTVRSPYVRRVDDILQRLMEAGVTEKWKSMFFAKTGDVGITDFTCINKKEESMQVLRQIFFVLIFGYSFSIFTFFVELFLVWRLKYRARNLRISRLLARR